MNTIIGWVPRRQTLGFESRRFCGDTCGVKEAGWAEGSWPGVKLSEEPENGPRDGAWPWRCPCGTHRCAVTSPHASPGESRVTWGVTPASWRGTWAEKHLGRAAPAAHAHRTRSTGTGFVSRLLLRHLLDFTVISVTWCIWNFRQQSISRCPPVTWTQF